MDSRISKILEFADKYELCVVSTCAENKPESALVGFAITNKLEVIFNTASDAKKYKNLQKNRLVSVVIGFGDLHKTLQIEGEARELEQFEVERVKSEHSHKVGFFSKWKIKYIKYFKVTPRWARLSDYTDFPPKTEEVAF